MMSPLTIARDLAVAIIFATIFGAALNGLSRRAERQTPHAYFGVAITFHADADTHGAADAWRARR